MIAWKPFSTIVDVVSKYRDVTELDLKSAQRHRDVVQARFEVCWLAKQLTNMSLPAIGRGLGGRDHTTVMSAVGRVEAARENDPAYASELSELRLLAEGAIRSVHGALPDQKNGEADASEIAHRILAPGYDANGWNRSELQVLARALIATRSQLADHQDFAKRLHNTLSKLP